MKKQLINFILLLILFTTITGCNSKSNDQKNNLITVDSLQIEAIDSPGVCCNGNDYLFIYDLYQNTVFKVRNNKVIDSLFCIGKGPGEYKNISDIAYNDKHVYVLDRFLMRVTKYNENFEYISSFTLKYQPNSMLVTDESVFVTTSVSDYLVYEYSHSGEQKNTYIKNELKGEMASAIANILKLAFYDGKLYGGYLTKSEIIEIDVKENTLNTYKYTISNPVKKAEVIQNGGNISSCTGTIYCSDLLIKDNHLLFVSGGGFTGTQEGRTPIEGMKYYCVTKDLSNENSNFTTRKLNIPTEDMLGYQITSLKDEETLLSSPVHSSFYIFSTIL